MNYRQLLKKYIQHVEQEEGTTFLSAHHPILSEVKFTPDEWAELKELQNEPLDEEVVGHNCSCHSKGQGPCIVCKALDCEVFNLNTIVYGVDDRSIYHTYSPECPEGCHGQLEGCKFKEEHKSED